MNQKNMLKVKVAISVLLLIDFAIVLITGLLLAGNVPSNVGKLHTVSGYIMGLLAVIHIILNLKLLKGEITGKIIICFEKEN